MGKAPKPIRTPIEEIKEIYDYEPNTGIFRFKKPIVNARKKAGDIAGYLTPKGYIRLSVKGQDVMAQRLAWFIHHGNDPFPNIVDHKNRKRNENWIDNLRLATEKENSRNRNKGINNRTGTVGVYPYGKKFEVRIEDKRIGVFDTFREASIARKKAEKKHYGEFSPE